MMYGLEAKYQSGRRLWSREVKKWAGKVVKGVTMVYNVTSRERSAEELESREKEIPSEAQNQLGEF